MNVGSRWLESAFKTDIGILSIGEYYAATRQWDQAKATYETAANAYETAGTNRGNNTQDKVFLLSFAEANKYLGVTYSDRDNIGARVNLTAYTVKKGGYKSSSYKTVDGNSTGWWWLRSPGFNLRYAASVHYNGSLERTGVSAASGSVRPALWVDIESEVFN